MGAGAEHCEIAEAALFIKNATGNNVETDKNKEDAWNTSKAKTGDEIVFLQEIFFPILLIATGGHVWSKLRI